MLLKRYLDRWAKGGVFLLAVLGLYKLLIVSTPALDHSLNDTGKTGEVQILQSIYTSKVQSQRRLPMTNIISYSFYGNSKRYTDGALANAKLYKTVFPGWTMRVYHDDTVPKEIIDQMRDDGVQLVDITWGIRNRSILNKMSWRFLPASDPTVDRFCSRDIDSRLSAREKAAVDAWVKSGEKFHIMRDHPSHSFYAMSGGMWCATNDAIPDMDRRLKTNHITQAYLQDMDFLNKVVWPLAQKSVLQHDSFSCDKFGGGSPFPSPRVGWEHVGSVYIDGKMRQGDVNILKNSKIVEKCMTQKD